MRRIEVHSTLYWLSLCLLAVGMTTSVFLSNLAWVLLLANWILEGRWSDKWRRMKSSPLLHAFVALMAVHLLWLVGNDNPMLGLDDIRQKLPLLVIPLVLLSSRPLERRRLWWVVALYVLTVTVVSVIGVVRYIVADGMPYRSISPFISHIRFGLNVSLVLCLAAYGLIKQLTRCEARLSWRVVAAAALMVWLLFFLVLMRAYTSFLALMAVAAVMSLLFVRRIRSVWLKSALFVSTALVAVSLFFLLRGYVNDYYGDCHRDSDVVEFGGYIYRDIDTKQVLSQWQRMTGRTVDDTTVYGNAVYPTLIRYLNATGRTKDSAGVASLSSDDIDIIWRGVANPVTLKRFSLRGAVCQLLFEYECYRNGEVENHSLPERFELWRAAWRLFLSHPWLGVGTGDVMPRFHAQLSADASVLAGTDMGPHNQYLLFLAAFGIVGVAAIMFFFVRALCLDRRLRSPLAVAFLCLVLVSMLSDNMLGTLAGCLFVAMPCSLLVIPCENIKKEDDSCSGTKSLTLDKCNNQRLEEARS